MAIRKRGGSGMSTEAIQDMLGTFFIDSASVDFTYDDAGNSMTAAVLPAGVDHNSLANLTAGDVHTQYAKLLGRAGGQTLIGGTAASNNLTLQSTSNATRGAIVNSDRALFADGTVSLPGIALSTYPSTGFYNNTSGPFFSFAQNGVETIRWEDGTPRTRFLAAVQFDAAVTFAIAPATADGSAAAPSIHFTAQPTSGFYKTTNGVGYTNLGDAALEFGANSGKGSLIFHDSAGAFDREINGADSSGKGLMYNVPTGGRHQQRVNNSTIVEVAATYLYSAQPIIGEAGSVGAATFNCNDPDTGMWQSAANNVDFTTGGTNRLNIARNAGADIGVATITSVMKLAGITTTVRDTLTPAAGMVIYNTTLSKLQVYTSAWETITSI